ncbi:MAG: aspartate aminotransferase [Candidatus Omnitrophota bacterium]|nr:MAG: aspartate aminotransferase [Candidatus Omnitrophota bacterium]
MKFASRVRNVSPSATLAISARAKEIRATGEKVINFAAGEPDFDTPEFVKKKAIEAIQQGKTKYTPVSGIEELKKAIIRKLKEENNLNYTPSQILVCTGAKQGIYNFLQAVCEEGDEVIIPSPYWVSYPEIVNLCSAVPLIIPTEKVNGFKLTPSLLKSFISAHTKVLILNSPANPTGALYTFSELSKIAEIAVRHGIYILSDEVYEKITYEKKHISIASLSSEVYRLTVVVNGVSKSWAMTGWRIGYVAGDEQIISKMSVIQSHSTSCPNSIAQYAALAAFEEREFPSQMLIEFRKRRDYILKKLEEIGISYIKPEGGFYVFFRINSKEDSKSFALKLLNEERVAVVPGVAFGREGWIRLSFATSFEDIKEGMQRIERFVRRRG